MARREKFELRPTAAPAARPAALPEAPALAERPVRLPKWLPLTDAELDLVDQIRELAPGRFLGIVELEAGGGFAVDIIQRGAEPVRSLKDPEKLPAGVDRHLGRARVRDALQKALEALRGKK